MTFDMCPSCSTPMRVRRTTKERICIVRQRYCPSCGNINFDTMEIHRKRYEKLLKLEEAENAMQAATPEQLNSMRPAPLPAQVNTPAQGTNAELKMRIEAQAAADKLKPNPFAQAIGEPSLPAQVNTPAQPITREEIEALSRLYGRSFTQEQALEQAKLDAMYEMNEEDFMTQEEHDRGNIPMGDDK